MASEPKFEFCDIVLAAPRSPSEISGEPGVVLGRTPTEEREWYYSVFFEKTKSTWCLFEREMTSTGKRDESYSKGSGTVRVSVDEEGRGQIIPRDDRAV
jgi:hypothetical protein